MKSFAITTFLIIITQTPFCQSISINFYKPSPQQQYAAGLLKKTLEKKGYSIKALSPTYSIQLVVNAKVAASEAFIIQPAGKAIIITGGDERGLIYGCLSLAEDIRNGIKLEKCKAKNEKPFLAFRAIKYDLPWDTYRHSYGLSLHDETCRDTSYWKAFLDMMVQNRFNALSLWNLHPYTFLIKPKNFPEASPWNDKEMAAWQLLFHTITRMANERAIDTYIVPFNIFVTPEFAKAHNVAMDNLEHDYFVRGDTSEIIRRYTRECVTQMLEEYPDLSGIGLTLGEGMGGMTPQQREDWMTATIIEGMRLANRRSKLIHRIPFSSTTGSLGVTSIETEKLTRKTIEKEAAMGFTEGPVWADLKFNWSHAHSTTKLIKVHGGKLYDGYFNPDPTAYKIVWTARNEDFFCLRWGVPSFVREHILQNKRPYSGGYIIGSETYIPAKDYFTRDTAGITWRYAFERQWLFYKLWGRLLYDPHTPDALFKAEFRNRYGANGESLLSASSLAGSAAPGIASYYDCGWDFTLYTEGMMALDTATKSVDYISVDRLIRQPPLDTSYVSVADYVRRTALPHAIFDKQETTPVQLANRLERDSRKALLLVSKINTAGNKTLRYEVADIKAWAWLGLHFAEKIRSAIALATYRSRGNAMNKEKAVVHVKRSLQYWDQLVALTSPLYKQMPLVHYSQQGGRHWKENFYLSFHWEMRRKAVEKDVEAVENARLSDSLLKASSDLINR